FAPRTDIPLGVQLAGLAVGDFNGDGRPDVVAAPTSGTNWFLLPGTGGGAFAAPILFAAPANPREIRAADLNGDGRLDLAAVVNGSDSAWTLLGDGAGNFAAARSFPAG